jgi:hypothetical protein
LALGASDCEALRDSLLAQPVNAATSLSYAAIGAWLLASMTRPAGPTGVPGWERSLPAAYGFSLIATGLGSFAYHGPMPPGAELAHDLPIVALLLVVAVRNLTVLGVLGPRVGLGVAMAATSVAGSLLAARPGTTRLLGGAVAGGALATAALVARCRRDEPGRGSRRAYRTAVALLGVGAVLNGLGRTDAPLCWPRSPFQPHAAWHLLSAAAAGCYGLSMRRDGRTGVAGQP